MRNVKNWFMPGRFVAVCLMALLAFAVAGLDGASLERQLDNDFVSMKHAIGWDTLNMKTLRADSSGRPTLERSSDGPNRVIRKTTYFDNGNREVQTVSVVSKANRKELYSGEQKWNSAGDLAYSSSADNAYNQAGNRTLGETQVQNYENGKMTKEVKTHELPGSRRQRTTLVETVSYFDDGDMEQRIIEKPQTGEKTRETWSEAKGTMGMRTETTQNWIPSKGVWQ